MSPNIIIAVLTSFAGTFLVLTKNSHSEAIPWVMLATLILQSAQVVLLYTKRLYLLGSFCGVTVAILGSILVNNILLLEPFTSWRGVYFSLPEVISCLSDLFIAQCSVMLFNAYPIYKTDSTNTGFRFQLSKLSQQVLIIMPWTYLALFIAFVGLGARDSQFGMMGKGSNFVMQLVLLLSSINFTLCAFAEGRLAKTGTFSCILVIITIALAGYRSILVSMLSVFLIRGYEPTGLTWKKGFLTGCVLIPIYFLLLFIAIARQNSDSILDSVRMLINGKLNTETVLGGTGAHEQSMFVSYMFFRDPPELLYGTSYWDGVVNLVPSFLRVDTNSARIQDYIAKAQPGYLQNTGLNLGAYLPTEATINFGHFGTIFVMLAFSLFFYSIEMLKFKNRFVFALYLILASQIHGIAYYGFTNSIKFTTYGITFVSLFFLIDIALQRNTRST